MTSLLHLVLLFVLAAGAPGAIVGTGPFAFAIEKTPEEGPVDPEVTRRNSAAWRACTKARSSTVSLIPCYEKEFARQDAILNRAWFGALHHVQLGRRAELITAERQWIATRDPFCARFVGGLRGSLVSVAYLDCRIELTIRRTMWLEKR